MGQLEKYGLYVLCLVIFLILGVTLWGGGDTPAPSRKQEAQTTIRAANPGVAPAPGPTAPPANTTPPANEASSSLVDLNKWLQPESTKNDPKKVVAEDPAKAKEKAEGSKAVDAPAASTPTTYKVQQGDTFESIARAKLGDAKRQTEIAKLNPNVKPKALRIGQELVLPGAKPAAKESGKAVEATVEPKSKDPKAKDGAAKDGVAKDATAKAVAPKAVSKDDGADRSYVVGKGDTFGRIAQTQLGSSKRIDEIRELNPNVDPTRLRIGQRLKLPKK